MKVYVIDKYIDLYQNEKGSNTSDIYKVNNISNRKPTKNTFNKRKNTFTAQ